MWIKIDDTDIDNAYKNSANPEGDLLDSTITVTFTTATNTQLLSLSNTVANAKALGYIKETWELVPVMVLMAFVLLILIMYVFFRK